MLECQELDRLTFPSLEWLMQLRSRETWSSLERDILVGLEFWLRLEVVGVDVDVEFFEGGCWKDVN